MSGPGVSLKHRLLVHLCAVAVEYYLDEWEWDAIEKKYPFATWEGPNDYAEPDVLIRKTKGDNKGAIMFIEVEVHGDANYSHKLNMAKKCQAGMVFIDGSLYPMNTSSHTAEGITKELGFAIREQVTRYVRKLARSHRGQETSDGRCPRCHGIGWQDDEGKWVGVHDCTLCHGTGRGQGGDEQ